jgi:hypothetical protein
LYNLAIEEMLDNRYEIRHNNKMTRNNILLILTLIMLPYITLAQEDEFDNAINDLKQQFSIPSLSKEQMYDDFDTFISIMARCNPQYLIRKSVTGYDMLAAMQSHRHLIDSFKNTESFILLLSKMLDLTQDQHCTHGTNLWWHQYSFYEKDVKINKITDKEFGINFHYKDIINNEYSSILDVFLINNKYYLKYPTTFFSETDSIDVDAGSEILFLNDKYPLYFDTLCSTRWNFENHFFYSDVLFLYHEENTIQLQSNNEIINYQFISLIQQERESFGSTKIDVLYLSKDSVLYIRVPFMIYNPQIKENLQQQLLSHKYKPIKSVIIDVRGNPGGNDELWITLLGMIINKPIKFNYMYISNTDNDVFERLGVKKAKKIQFDCLNSNYDFSIVQKGKYRIPKQKESLNYQGMIYLLADEDIYSSTCGLTSLNQKTDAIKVIGMPTGKLQGQGINSVAFMLPHSKFTFLLDVLLDATNIKNAEDFYFGHIDYPLSPNIDYYRYWYGLDRSYKTDENELYTKDDIFLKTLEMIKHINIKITK